jgi:probable HAF family extracellular repeat protein
VSVQSYARGINARGDVVGATADAHGRRCVFHFHDGRLTLLPVTLGSNASDAFGIDNAGTIVGQLRSRVGSHAMCYRNGLSEDLGTLGGYHSLARAINGSGQIVGWAETPQLDAHAFLFTSGAMQDLGTLGGARSEALAINDAGDVVGTAETRNGEEHAFCYRDGRMEDLGMLPGSQSSRAHATNVRGDIVGICSSADGVARPFLYRNGHMTALGGLAIGQANGINGAGQVVGDMRTTSGTLHAFLFSNGVTHDLNEVIPAHREWELQQAWAINDAGQIVGTGAFHGHSRAFLLTPTMVYRALPSAAPDPHETDGIPTIQAYSPFTPVRIRAVN